MKGSEGCQPFPHPILPLAMPLEGKKEIPPFVYRKLWSNGSAIYVFSMHDSINVNALRVIIYPIENAIIPPSETIPLLSREFEAAGGPSIFGKSADAFHDFLKDSSLEIVQVLLGRGKKKDFKHGASSGIHRGRRLGVPNREGSSARRYLP